MGMASNIHDGVILLVALVAGNRSRRPGIVLLIMLIC